MSSFLNHWELNPQFKCRMHCATFNWMKTRTSRDTSTPKKIIIAASSCFPCLFVCCFFCSESIAVVVDKKFHQLHAFQKGIAAYKHDHSFVGSSFACLFVALVGLVPELSWVQWVMVGGFRAPGVTLWLWADWKNHLPLLSWPKLVKCWIDWIPTNCHKLAWSVAASLTNP